VPYQNTALQDYNSFSKGVNNFRIMPKAMLSYFTIAKLTSKRAGDPHEKKRMCFYTLLFPPQECSPLIERAIYEEHIIIYVVDLAKSTPMTT
jgi:hypothetical protein